MKSHHHLHRLSQGPPPSLQQKADELADFAKPAFRNDFFDEIAKRLAEDWLEATHRALLNHYEDTLEASRLALGESTMPGWVLERSLQVITRWARRQLGSKLDCSILDTALSDIRAASRIDTTESTATTQPLRHDGAKARRSTHTQTEPVPEVTSQQKVWFSQRLPSREEPQPEEQPAVSRPPPPSPLAAAIPEASLPTEPTDPEVDLIDLDAPLPVKANSRPSRKRLPEELSQIDLFDSFGSQPPRQRSRSLSIPRGARCKALAPTKEAVLLGDDNLLAFDDKWTNVYAFSNGRLSHFRTLLRACKEPFPGVKRLVLVVSHLDRRNTLNTNLTTIKNIVSAAKTVFPQAKCAVACDGICDCQPEEVRDSITALNAALQATPPNRVTVLPPPDNFDCKQGRWSEATKNYYWATLSSFLC